MLQIRLEVVCVLGGGGGVGGRVKVDLFHVRTYTVSAHIRWARVG